MRMSEKLKVNVKPSACFSCDGRIFGRFQIYNSEPWVTTITMKTYRKI